jgi:two-component system chemotaxis response regulator CheY
MKIAVIDDVAMNIRILTNAAKEFGEVHGFQEVTAGLDAIRVAFMEGKPFDVLFLDVMMPVMDGIAVLPVVRKMAVTYGMAGRMKVVMVTARNEQEVVRRAIRAGASGYILKPFDTGRIRDELTKIAAQFATAEPAAPEPAVPEPTAPEPAAPEPAAEPAAEPSAPEPAAPEMAAAEPSA